MPLQIRRAEDEAQRLDLTVPLKEGEPLWVLETGGLYIGDGVTAGGIQVNAPVDLTEFLPTYQGQIGEFEKDPINQPGVKSGFLAFDGENVVIDLDGQISTDVRPRLTEEYNLGTGNFRFRKVWVGGEGIAIGEATITASIGPYVELPAGSQVAGSAILTVADISSLPPPDINGSFYNIGITADDSTTMIDPSSRTISGSVLRIEDILSDSENINLGNADDSLLSINAFSESFKLTGISGTTLNDGPLLEIGSSNGTISSPTTLISGDTVGRILYSGYNGTAYRTLGAIITQVDTVTGSESTPGKLLLSVRDFDGGIINAKVSLDSRGVFSSTSFGLFPVEDSTERDTKFPSPTEGMMVFNSTLQKFQGYVSDTGLASGGPSNSTPGWIDLN
jgi:hypothetical protein